MFTTKQVQACARALPVSMPGSSNSSGTSSIARITSTRAPFRLANHRLLTTSKAIRPKKNARLNARVRRRRGANHSSGGNTLGFLATRGLQGLGGGRQALAKGASQGDLVLV